MKKIVSVLIVLTLLVNVLGFGFLNVRASAAAEAIGFTAASVVLGLLSGALGGAISNNAWKFDSNSQDFIDAVNGGAVARGEVVQIVQYGVEGNYQYEFVPVSGLEGDAAEFAQMFCNKLNVNADYYADVFKLMNTTGAQPMSSAAYLKLKNDTVNSFNTWAASKGFLEEYAQGTQAMAQQGLLPQYEFDWRTGGLPINLPAQTSYVDVDKNGYKFAAPLVIGQNFDEYSTSLSTTKPYADGTLDFRYTGHKYSDNQYSISYDARNTAGYYGFGAYYIVNGVMYTRVNNYNNPNTLSGYNRDYVGETRYYKNENGDRLSDILPAWSNLTGYRWGIFVLTEPYDPNAAVYPAITEFEETTGGGTLEYTNTDQEQIIQEAIAAGLLPEDFMLKLDELGNIISANNIPLDKLQSLLEQIKNGQMQFEDFEEYLSYISALLSKGNFDRETSNKILNSVKGLQEITNNKIDILNTAIAGLKDLDQARNDSLSRIEANTATIAAAISDSQITASTDFDVQTPSIITDKFPFSLPFDIYHAFNLLSAEPQAPQWTIPIEMDGVFDYSIDVDLSEYDWIANIVRWLLYAVFIVGLILATNKLIGRG